MKSIWISFTKHINEKVLVHFILGSLVGISLLGNIYLSTEKNNGINRLAQAKSVVDSKNNEAKVLNERNGNPEQFNEIIRTTPPSQQEVRVPILMYHYVGDYYSPSSNDPNNALMGGLAVTVENFEKQMNFLFSEGYTSITLANLLSFKQGSFIMPDRPVVLSFDDGYKDFYTNAFPILKKYNFKSEVFIVNNFIDKEQYLSKDMIKELLKTGLVSIGSHTLNHTGLTTVSIPEIKNELLQSKQDLEKEFKIVIENFCYPFGYFDADIANLAKESGYKISLTTQYGSWTKETNLMEVPRVRISGYYGIAQFKGVIQ
jgi:peptidoglycan/xylan/chitin deacetylase (PgdA/CDA1 family)